MPYSNRVLIIDDRPEDGEAIAKRLWEDQIPNCFVRFDEGILNNIRNKFYGIRVVFQDIKLISGSGVPGNSDYGAASQLLDALLEENNGPWLMVAWSTWAEDPEQGHQYAQQLFNFLRERLPNGKKPRTFLVLDKKPYTIDHDHGVVRSDEELGSSEKSDLLTSIREFYEQSVPVTALTQWEQNVGGCASSVINELWEMTADLDGDREDQVIGLLKKLSKAQNGRVGEDIAEALHGLLSSLLIDRLTYSVPESIILDDKEYAGSVNKVNTMLHWDGHGYENVNSPGSIYAVPVDSEFTKYFFEASEDNYKGFIYANFIANKGDQGKSINEADKDENFASNVRLVFLDLTPPCDHDNSKAVWRKMLLGIKVICSDITEAYTKHMKNFGYLKKTPIFCVPDTEFYFVFNSNLILTLPDDDDLLNSFEYIGRAREQLLRDYVAWLGGMITRPGIVSVH